MNRIVVLIVAGVLYPVSVRVDGQTAVLNAAAENTIQQLERQWEDALLKNDQVAIDRIVAHDCLFVSSTGEFMTKSQADADRRNTTLQASTTTQTIIRVLDADTAVVIGTNVETSQYAGQDTSGQYRWTDVFQKRNGQWQVVSAQSTRIDGSLNVGAVPTEPRRPVAESPVGPVEGLSPEQVRARLGNPSLVQTDSAGVTTWYFDTAQGTMKVYIYRGKASSNRPQ